MNRVFVKKDDPLYKYALDFMERSWGTKGKGIFPGCQPISIERGHFNILSNNDYVVCEKTDGRQSFFANFPQVLCIHSHN